MPNIYWVNDLRICNTKFIIQFMKSDNSWNTFYFLIRNNKLYINHGLIEELSCNTKMETLKSQGLFIDIFTLWLSTSDRLRYFMLLNDEEYNLLINKDNYTK